MPNLDEGIFTGDVSDSIIVTMKGLEAVGQGLTSLFTELHLVFRFLAADVDNMQFSIIDKSLKARNMVVGKVKLLKVDKSLQTLHFDNLIALQFQHF